MSARPGEELDPEEGKWFEEDRNGLSGDTSTRFDEGFKTTMTMMGDLDRDSNLVRDEGKRNPVAMGTASTDPISDLLGKCSDGDMYTSLLSNQNFSSGLEASFLSDSKNQSSGSSDPFSSSTKSDFSLFDDMPKSLMGTDKTESYNYMDISHSEERQQVQPKLVDMGFGGHDSLGSYMDKIPGRHDDEEEEEEEEEEEKLGPALGSHSFPYVEEPSDEELSDYRSYRNLGGTPQTASPVKITLTESHPPLAARAEPPKAPSPVGGPERENVLSVGQQGVPTVTLSEPEDESPASSPNTSPIHKQFPSSDMFKVDTVKPGVTKTGSGHRGHDGSSAESGDSDIELVSEEPLKAGGNNPFAPAPKSKDFFESPPPAGKAGLSNHAAPPSYSILREEREAELDTDLFIESASDESPKRGHDLKQGVVGAPSPLVPSPCAPGVPPAAKPVEPPGKPKTPAEESKPKPPTAAVTPELRSDTPPQEDKHGDVVKCSVSKLLTGLDKQKAIDLLYWRNVKQSGAVFSSVLLLLFSLTQFSVVSVGAYLALAALSATISFRIYKSVLQAVQKTDEGHPFKVYLEVELALSQDQISKYADKILLYTNTCMRELRRLFLVQDLIDSLKFAVLMWLLTYVGALFNGLTLLILAVISMFTMPVVYEKHQAQIDQYVGLIRGHVNAVVGKIQAKIPGAKRKEE